MKGQKILIGLVILLTLGLIFQGAYMIKLKNRVDTFDKVSSGTDSSVFTKKPALSNLFSRGRTDKFNTDWYFDDFFGGEWEPFEEMGR